jgi:hypothetical protein
MSNHFAKFATAIAVAILATLALSAVPRTANAADECLTEPTGPSSQGKHWYYHIERGTGRHCWYQRGQDDTAAIGTAQDQSTAADDDASPATDQVVAARDQAPAAKPISKPVAKKSETPATRSIADARAELPTKTRTDDDSTVASTAAPATAAVAVAAAAPSAPNATVWPNPQAALAAKPVAAETAPTTSSDTDTQQDTSASITSAAAPSPAPATQAGPLGNRHLGSLPMLLLVAFGALGLAGLTGSTVYRLATLRRRVRPEDRWNRNVAFQPAPPRRPRPVPARPEPIEENVQENLVQENQENFQEDFQENFQEDFQDYVQEPVEDEIAPEQVVRVPVARKRFELEEVPRTEMGSADGNRRREQIEAHLAQLTRQLQADLEVHARAG